MAEKDIIEKTLIGYNDVFSDICNGFLFNGKQVVGETQLSDATALSIFKTDGDFHSQERDVAKYWNKSILRTAMFGIENQSSVNSDMPLRVISYDGAAYRQQLDTDAPRYPVITIVIYFGKGKWGKNRSLHDVLNIPKKLKSFVNDYKILVLEMNQMTEEQVQLYHSDFKYVADYFVQSKKDPNYRGSKETIKHVREFFRLMALFTSDNRFELAYNEKGGKNILEGGKINNMCDFLDKIENEGIEKGKAQGIEEGKAQGIEQVILKMIEEDASDQQIILYTGASEEKIKELRKKLVLVK